MNLFGDFGWLSFFEEYGILIVFVLAFAFVVWYFVGGWINLKVAKRYAGLIEESMKTRSLGVKYRRVSGGRGFRALCLLRDKEHFERFEVAINLADRDNTMHYILAPITRDEDRFLCWVFPNAKPDSSVEIVPNSRVKGVLKSIRTSPEKFGKLRHFKLDEAFDREFSFFAENVGIAHRVCPPRIRSRLLEMKKVIRGVSVDREEGFMRLAGTARAETIPSLLDLAWEIGRAVASG